MATVLGGVAQGVTQAIFVATSNSKVQSGVGVLCLTYLFALSWREGLARDSFEI